MVKVIFWKPWLIAFPGKCRCPIGDFLLIRAVQKEVDGALGRGSGACCHVAFLHMQLFIHVAMKSFLAD